ncbi:LytTR family DNA-binding domain-containing protein [Lysobacter enzymogenes]|uniref:LytTR family DNA-binding domain-containing protein n=1 Tax=Lysobacter enzymogenes TaxID=69 RepID=UPI0008977B34|nr:LytTR family DNA-binding domain-containing protein [Lysobacter enzymogenes]SDW90060.1 LytTr DNA-binding domain-containing protein [Lysobacter enzymogenes]
MNAEVSTALAAAPPVVPPVVAPAAAAAPARSAWDRYQPWRRPLEVAFWVVLFAVNAAAGTLTAIIDIHRYGLAIPDWAPLVWETSSCATALALVPALVWFTRAVPLRFDRWRRALALHLLASVVWSVLHVVGMVAIRQAVYASLGERYDWGDWGINLLYEYLKDVRSYGYMVLWIEGYRLLLRRWQGEASVLAAPDDLPAPAQAERPERFLVRKLGKEFLVAANEVEWLQASSNYVNLRVRGRDYPLRSTMAAIEVQLDPARFARVHRSYIVNLDCVGEIEPLDSGDARITMRDGSQVPCSRRYRAALRQERRAG